MKQYSIEEEQRKKKMKVKKPWQIR